MRTQISTGVSQRTRDQTNELIKENGYSLRELIAIAIDRMHREEFKTMNKPNVHYKFTDKDGNEWYGIGHWVESAGQYQCPLDAETRKLTGCHTEFAKTSLGKMTREKAHREARRLYGYSQE